MTNFKYTRDIPFPTNAPSVDQPKMRINNNSIDAILKVDHEGFNLDNGGYHTIIHQDNPISNTRTRAGSGATLTNFPVAISQINQLFQAYYTPQTTGGVADTQLFNVSGNGQVSQLTGYLAKANNETEGWQWVGGVLLQWGTVSFSGSSRQDGTVTFKDRVTNAIPFPNYLYNVQTTLHAKGGAGTSNTQNVSVFTLSRTSFGWNYTGSSAYDYFYWFAIGS